MPDKEINSWVYLESTEVKNIYATCVNKREKEVNMQKARMKFKFRYHSPVIDERAFFQVETKPARKKQTLSTITSAKFKFHNDQQLASIKVTNYFILRK